MTTKKRGRPKLAPNLAKGILLSVRVSQKERSQFERAARREGLTLSKWARRELLQAAS